MNKREFIKTLSIAGIGLPLHLSAFSYGSVASSFPDSELPEEEFWKGIRDQYDLKTEYINLENGYYNILPKPILNAQIEAIKSLNREGSFYMRNAMIEDRMKTRKILSEFLHCSIEEVIITRNTTESMDTVISGTDWKAGDEAVMAYQDYGSMLDMFKQLAKRNGIINKMISIPLHPNDDDEIVQLYEKAITPKTKLIMLCHMINITGQILPVKKICDMAHSHGVKVLVDGAHAVGHFDFKISELNCDYYASSLHKWLSVPLGAGLLYVKKENINALWPLFGEASYSDDDIRKLNHTGTMPVHVELSISSAIQFLNKIGIERKENRLRYLQNYWTKEVVNLKGFRFNTPLEKERHCGIANIGIENMKPYDMAKTLLDKYKIWTVAIDSAGVQGCRITPNVYTSLADLDTLIHALKEMKG